jgi:predicted nucleic acid-binding protein
VGLIYLDSCVVIYLVERHPNWGDAVTRAMKTVPEARFGISPLVKCECLVGPLKRGDPVLEQTYLDLFERLLSLEMPDSVYLRAAQLRARFGIRTPDALHLASAQYHGCDSLWTNDDRLVHASHGLSVNILR